MSRAMGCLGVVAVLLLMGSIQDAAGSEHKEVLPDGILKLSVNDAPAHASGTASSDEDLEPPRLSMEFQDANLKDVLKTFSRQTGINVIAGKDLEDQLVTLYLEDVTALDALDQILRASHLTYERPPGSEIYIVKPQAPEGAQTITRVYRLKFARVSKSILAKAAAAFGNRTPFEATLRATTAGGTSISGSGAGGSGGGTGGLGGGATGKEEDVGIDVVIRGLLTPAGSVVVDARTNSLILTDVPENFVRLEAALAALDIRTPQIMVDAEILETTLTKLKDLGVEWGKGAEGDFATFTPGSRKTRFPFSWMGRAAPSNPTAFSTSTIDASSAIGVLQALEKDGDTKILARPKVLTLDNESAVIRLTADEAIGFQTTTGEQTATTTAEPERTTTGVLLVVTPQVNEDRYITMLVEPSVTKTVESKISPPANQATPRDPKTRSARALVRIRSGDTLVVGGLIDRSDEQSLRKVPILSGIPVFGEAFKNTELNNSASELIVFITPRLLEEATASQIASAGQTPLGMREQEASGARQEAIQETLNQLEHR